MNLPLNKERRKEYATRVQSNFRSATMTFKVYIQLHNQGLLISSKFDLVMLIR